jgi:hypothetical protein
MFYRQRLQGIHGQDLKLFTLVDDRAHAGVASMSVSLRDVTETTGAASNNASRLIDPSGPA